MKLTVLSCVCIRSSSGEAAWAALAHSAYAFRMVGGLEKAGLFFGFAIGMGADALDQFGCAGEIAAQSGARAFDSERRVLGDFPRELHRRGADIIGRGQDIGQANFNRRIAAQPAPGQKQQRRLLLADQPRQRIGQAKTGMNPQLDKIGRKARLLN